MGNYVSDVSVSFDRFLNVERNLSAQTRRAYKFEIKRFLAFLIRSQGKEPPLDKIQPEHLRNYLSYLQIEKGYKSAALSRSLASLKTLFNYCVEQKLINVSPAAPIHNPKQPRRLPIYLVESELKSLIEATEESQKPFLGLRNRAILIILAFTGIRLTELVSLNLTDIDFERQTMRIMGKGAKERLVPMNKLVQQVLIDYLNIRPITEEGQALLLNRRGKRLTGRSVERIVKKYVRMAGLGSKKISPHKLRHTFATLLHLNEVDLIEIQALLGHTSIRSTQIYTHTNPERLRSAVEKLEDI